MARYRRSNPLALAVLAQLWERPQHPYEVATTLRERHKDTSVKLNYGSLYTVVDSLEQHGFIEALEARREGGRPERTVYGLTEDGREELYSWLRDLIGQPVKEYPRFEAGVSLIGIIEPDEVVVLLRRRAELLRQEIDALGGTTEMLMEMGLPALSWIELSYRTAITRAELEWVEQLVTAIENDAIDGIEQWREWHSGDAPPGSIVSEKFSKKK
ncbi:PadR family transcriptional regulator [Lentzea sp. NBRC 105346]|uniref:PadR family transcriptional regulator n=1 Tax=Lentzea sp. NBRC 105346 TaxID=3032205 RepID=UPI0024A43037|nr:PadR family transcriptional regulator [Lentzea sp. NBRC 105346]GLZ34996.1 PadR family transcriptional regulator [Lentzea sp. NBRC 105346]